MANINKTWDSSRWREIWSKGNTDSLLVGAETCTATLEIGVEVLHEAGMRSTSRPSYTNLGRVTKGSTPFHRDSSSSMIIAALYFKSQKLEKKKKKKPRGPSTDG